MILHLTTRICHAKTIVIPHQPESLPPERRYKRDAPVRVMIPAYAKPAHNRLRTKLDEIRA